MGLGSRMDGSGPKWSCLTRAEGVSWRPPAIPASPATLALLVMPTWVPPSSLLGQPRCPVYDPGLSVPWAL